jgi:AcrR family transcriptional regulator
MGTERIPADRTDVTRSRGSANGSAPRPKSAAPSKAAKASKPSKAPSTRGKTASARTTSAAAANAGSDTADGGATPASRRALRNQGKRTMRKLLDAAMVAFDRRGYHATRVNDVVEIAKTSHGTFYLYFSNKEDLLRALVNEAAAEVQHLYDELTASRTEPSSWDDLRTWVGQYSDLWKHYAPLLRAWTDLASIDPELGAQVRGTVTGLADALSDRIAAFPHAQPVDSSVAGLAVLAMLDRFHYLREFVGEPVDDACLDTLTTIVHRALFDDHAAAPAHSRPA